MGSGLLRCQPGPMSCCRVSGGSSGLKAAPRGEFRDPKVSVACLFCPRRPWHTQCRSQVRLPWALSLRASQGHSMLPSKVSDSPGLACLLEYQGGLTALCWLPSSAHRVQEQQEPLERHCAGHLSTLAPPGPGPQCCPDCPSGADCEEPTCHPPWSHWQKFGHSSSGPSLLSPQASRRCTHSPPHNHPTLQMRKLRPSQARGLTEDHPTGKWWSSDLSPAPSGGSFFFKKKNTFY